MGIDNTFGQGIEKPRLFLVPEGVPTSPGEDKTSELSVDMRTVEAHTDAIHLLLQEVDRLRHEVSVIEGNYSLAMMDEYYDTK